VDLFIKILFIVIFFAVTFYIGFYCRKKAANSNDFVLGGRKVGPWLSAFAYGTDAVAPIKALADFAKTHEVVTLKVGIVDGAISDSSELAKLATIPSREGLLTMLAAGMMGIPKDLSICLDLYAKQKEEN
jgi:ribosomal protein L10